MTGVGLHRLDELCQRHIQSLNQGQSFRRSLHACGRNDVGCDLDCRCLANLADLDDLFAACFKNGTRFPQCGLIAADVVNQLALFRRGFAPREWRLDKTCAATFDKFRRGPHRIRSDRGMRDNNMPCCEPFAKLFDGFQQSFVVGNKDLDVITERDQFRRRTNKVWNRTRCPVPNENRKTFPAEIRGHAPTDNPEADHSNVFMFSMGHGCQALRRSRNY